MDGWYGILMSAMLFYPQLYPGYLMQEEKQIPETLKIGVSAGWILLFICIPILVLVYILFWKGAWFDKRTDHQSKNVQQK